MCLVGDLKRKILFFLIALLFATQLRVLFLTQRVHPDRCTEEHTARRRGFAAWPTTTPRCQGVLMPNRSMDNAKGNMKEARRFRLPAGTDRRKPAARCARQS